MKIIINTSNLFVGGGVQVALSFINELKNIKEDNEYHIFLSSEIRKQIVFKEFSLNFIFYEIEKSPASIIYRYKINKRLNKLEAQILPDCVFTIFGPSYWTPKSKHLMGLATGWVYNPNTIAFNELSFLETIKTKLEITYKKFFIKKNASCYVVETNDAKEKILKFLKIKSPIFVVGNTYSSIFDDSQYLNSKNQGFLTLPHNKRNAFRLILISHNYSHKNLKIIKKIIPLLKGYDVQFILTIDEMSYNNLFSEFKDNVLNLGTISQENCPSVYSQCDALFFPTLLETFSASYPEAMKMKLPILTSNYSFAKDICGNAGLYFNPLDEHDIVDKIIQIISSKKLRKHLISNGSNRLLECETASSRAYKYLEILNKIDKEE